MSVYIIRAFIEQRERLAANAAILKRLAEIDKTLLEHDAALGDIYEKLLPLLAPPPEPPRRQIGFSANIVSLGAGRSTVQERCKAITKCDQIRSRFAIG